MSDTLPEAPTPNIPAGVPESVANIIRQQFENNLAKDTKAATKEDAVAVGELTPHVAVSTVPSGASTTVAVNATAAPKESIWEKIGHGIATGLDDALKGVEEVITVGDRVIHVISDLKALTPEFKSDLSIVINDVKAVSTAVAPALVSDGTNVVADVSAFTTAMPAIIKLVQDFVSFVPQISAALAVLEGDATGTATTTSSSTTAPTSGSTTVASGS